MRQKRPAAAGGCGANVIPSDACRSGPEGSGNFHARFLPSPSWARALTTGPLRPTPDSDSLLLAGTLDPAPTVEVPLDLTRCLGVLSGSSSEFDRADAIGQAHRTNH